MKVRQIIVASLLAIGATAGIGASLAHVSDARVAKADNPDDKMFTVLLDLGEATSFDGFNSPEVHYSDASNGSLNKYQMMHLVNGNVYATNLTYRSSDQSVDTIEFLFKQNQDDKFSNSLNITPVNSNACLFSFHGTWTQDPNDGGRYEWELSKDSDWSGIRFQYYGDGDNNIQNLYLTADVATKTYKTTFEIVEEGFDATDNGQVFFAGWGLGAFRQSSIDTYMNNYSLNSFQLKEFGKYDLILNNGYDDGGVFELKKHEDTINSFIYYVTEGDQATTDKIYAWGDEEQFGEWPGTSITSITGVEEVTGGGVLHFQGSEIAKLIYKIPVKVGGYPDGDTHFKTNNGEWQSSEFTLEVNSTYWRNGSEGSESAAGAIDFLVEAEDIRNHAADYSVCNISDSDATILVNAYNALTADVRAFVDSSSVYTHKRDGSDGNELVSYRIVMEQLAKIANKPLVSSSNLLPNNKVNNDALIIVVIALSLISVTAIFLVFKKRKQN